MAEQPTDPPVVTPETPPPDDAAPAVAPETVVTPEPAAAPPAPAADAPLDPQTVLSYVDSTGATRMDSVAGLIEKANAATGDVAEQIKLAELTKKAFSGDDPAAAQELLGFFGGQPTTDPAQAAPAAPAAPTALEMQLSEQLASVTDRLSAVEGPVNQIRGASEVSRYRGFVAANAPDVPALALQPDAGERVQRKVAERMEYLRGQGIDPYKMPPGQQHQVIYDAVANANAEAMAVGAAFGRTKEELVAMLPAAANAAQAPGAVAPAVSGLTDDQGDATKDELTHIPARYKVNPDGSMIDRSGAAVTQNAIGQMVAADVPSAAAQGAAPGPVAAEPVQAGPMTEASLKADLQRQFQERVNG